MVRAELVFDIWVVAPDAVPVLNRMPLVKAATFAYLVAKMPLAEIGLVVVVRQMIDDGVNLVRQRDIVLVSAVGVRPSPCHNRRPRRRADRRRHIAVLNHRAGIRQPIHRRRLDPIVAISRHRIGTLLVREDKEEVGFLWFGRHGFNS